MESNSTSYNKELVAFVGNVMDLSFAADEEKSYRDASLHFPPASVSPIRALSPSAFLSPALRQHRLFPENDRATLIRDEEHSDDVTPSVSNTTFTTSKGMPVIKSSKESDATIISFEYDNEERRIDHAAENESRSYTYNGGEDTMTTAPLINAHSNAGTQREGETSGETNKHALNSSRMEDDIRSEQNESAQLRQAVQVLKERCARLEAQNILVSVQQLDLMAKGIAIALTCLALVSYWYVMYRWLLPNLILPGISNLTSWVTSMVQSYKVGDVQDIQESNFFGWGNVRSALLKPRLVTAVQKLDKTHAAQGLSTLKTTAASTVSATTVELFELLSPFFQFVLKAILFVVPYVHHKLYHGIFHRRNEVFAVFFIVFARVKLCRWREKTFATTSQSEERGDTDDDGEDADSFKAGRVPLSYGESTSEDSIWDANYEISARFLYVSIFRLRGLWTKTAQYLSSRADFMPPSYIRELKKLQDEAPTTDWDVIRTIMPLHILDAIVDVEKVPLASASIGQVHVAKLKKSGEKVAVKVQHPFAPTLLYDDFWSLKIICRIVTVLEPEYEFIEILMKEWSKEARKELDFEQEAQNLLDAQIVVNQMLKDCSVDGRPLLYTNRTKNCPVSVPFQVEVPRPFLDLCTKKVLVMSFCEGTRIDDFQKIDHEIKVPRESIIDSIAQTFAHMMYVGDIFNGDPHTGNILIRQGVKSQSNSTDSNGFTLVLLDWGLVKRLTDKQRLAFCQMVYAAATFDFGLLMDSYDSIGLKLKRENVAEDMEGMRHILREMTPVERSRRRIKAKVKTDVDRINGREKGDKIPIDSKAYPGEFFFFIRVNELLQGLGSKFHIELAYLDAIKPFAERGLSQYYSLVNTVKKDSTKSIRTSRVDSKDKVLERKVSDVIQDLKSKQQIAGIQVVVLDKGGNHLVNIVDGHFGGIKKDIRMEPDALILGYSCTKAVTATLAHIMVKQGYLSYDEPICERVWPSFCPGKAPPVGLYSSLNLTEGEVNERWAWKRMITLRHILTHTSGMFSALPYTMTIKSLASCEACCASFEYNEEKREETLLPTSCPGSCTEYHFMSFGWLIAGSLMGAYTKKHELKSVSFQEIYTKLLLPRLSKETLESGFYPCGLVHDDLSVAYTETDDISAVKIAQLKRDAEAHGEIATDEGTEAMQRTLQAYRGKEFLLDQRIWNCKVALKANVPAAGGRFTANGLANFYRDLASAEILDLDTLKTVTDVSAVSSGSFLQGQTNMTTADADGISMGMGYQLVMFDKDKESNKPSAFGHTGVGGSLGFHHKGSGVSVAVMMNKADGDRENTKRIVRAISDHLEW